MTAEPFKYRAFISYSHQDSVWASWLHKSLESYVVPRHLVGRETATGVLPRKLFPIFRDRDELSSSAELGGAINEALRQSAYQIVICSPRAAASRWVNEEVRYFKSLGRGDRVLALIVDGEPGASASDDPANDPAQECFPLALRRTVEADGRISDTPVEPIAADARRSGDGRNEARLKLIAGLLDVPYDELRQRERRRQFWQRLQIAAGSLALIAGLAGLWQIEQAQRAEKARLAQLDRWVEAGRQALLANKPASAATFLNAAYESGYDTKALRVLLGQAMANVDPQSTVRVHHEDETTGISMWMPDSRRFVSLWHDGRLWDADTGAQLAKLGDGSEIVLSDVAGSNDGRYLLLGGKRAYSADQFTASLYELPSGRFILSTQATFSTGRVGRAFRSFTPDGRLLALVDPEGIVSIHRSASGEEIWRVPEARANTASFNADGSRLVLAGPDSRISVWDVSRRQRLLTFDSGLDSGAQAFFIADGRIVGSSSKGKLKLYDGERGTLLDAYGGHNGAVSFAALSIDGRRMMTVASDGTKVWDLNGGDQLLHVTCACAPAEHDIDPTGHRLLARIDQQRVGLWDVDEQRLIAVLEAHATDVRLMHFSPDGQRVLTTSIGSSYVLWDATRFRSSRELLLPHEGPITPGGINETFSGMYSPDGKTLVTAGSDGTARLWNAADGRLLHVLRGHTLLVNYAVFSPDGRTVATGSDDLTARLWDVETGTERTVLDGHNRFVRRLEFSPDGSRLLTVAGTEPGLWNVADGTRIARLAGHTAPAVEGHFSSDGRKLVTTGLDGVPQVFDALNGQLLTTLKGHNGVVPTAFFVDGDRRIVTAGVDASVRIWDASSGQELKRMDEPLAGAAGFRHGTLSHDRQQVLLAGATGEMLLWRWQTGEIKRLTGHTVASYSAAFNADDRLAVTASNDWTTRVWDLASGQTIALLPGQRTSGARWSAAFNANASLILVTGVSTPPQAEIWALPHETRTSAEIALVLRCKSPWQVDGERLVAHAPEAAACSELARKAAPAATSAQPQDY